jgi:hypothetical protein
MTDRYWQLVLISPKQKETQRSRSRLVCRKMMRWQQVEASFELQTGAA